MTRGTRRVFTIVAGTSFITMIALVVYGLLEAIRTPNLPVGSQWVNVYWPFPSYFAQTATYFSVTCIALFCSRLRLWKVRIGR